VGRHNPVWRARPRTPADDVHLAAETTEKIYTRPPEKIHTRPPEKIHVETTEKIYVRGRRARTVWGALLLTLAATVLPGSGHLVLRRRAGWFIAGCFLLAAAAAAVVLLRVPRTQLAGLLLSAKTLQVAIPAFGVVALAWLAVVLRTYMVAMPRRVSAINRFVGAFVVTVLCVALAAPFAFAAYTVNAQRTLINALFPSSEGGAPTGDVEAIKKPRINIFLVGSDAGAGRIGTRTDTMVVASVDTRSGRTILFSLPRNIAHAPFPPGSAMAVQFPRGFGNPHDPSSGLLNGVYAHGAEFPQLAPEGPSRNPGLNLLMSTVGHILGLDLDFYIQVNMSGFASIIDALGGLDVNVGPEPLPMGGIGPFGEEIKPFGYIPAGQQHLTGEHALWFARSRKNSSDYIRMGRQRCLLQYLIDQKSPMDVLRNFQAVASATQDSVSTNIPQQLLPALMELAEKARARSLESVAFDPSLPDPGQPGGWFNTGDPDYPYVRQVVRNVIDAATPTTSAQPPAATQQSRPGVAAQPPPPGARPATKPGSTQPSAPARQGAQPAAPSQPKPTSLSEACTPPS
jgi:polyisoprenyl-teichoic acid--peptidoglycan teichoic acid transferase